jgi:hypothetical protein
MMNVISRAYKQYEERGGELNTKEDKLRALVEYRNGIKNYVRDYEYEAVVKCKLSGEVVGRIYALSMEGLLEETHKLEEAVKRDNKIIEDELDNFNYEQYKARR